MPAMRLKDPRRPNPKVEACLADGEGDAAQAGRWLADLVRATVKDAQEDIYHQMPRCALPDGPFFAPVSVYGGHAALGFSRGDRMDDPHGLFAPSASATYRAVRVPAPGAVPQSKLVPLIRQAAAIARQDM